jgi:hypothetical protein
MIYKQIDRSENDQEKHQEKSVKFSKLVARNALKTKKTHASRTNESESGEARVRRAR